MNNKITPQLVKDYIITARQIKGIERQRHRLAHRNGNMLYESYNLEPLQTKLKELYRQLFKD